MTWRPGLRAGIVLTVTLVTTVAMALTTYHLQAGTTRDRFTASAQAAFDSDTQQAHQFLVRSTAFESAVAGVAEYMRARLGLTWALVNFTPTSGAVSTSRDGRYVPVAGTTGSFPGQLPMSKADEARQRRGAVRCATPWTHRTVPARDRRRGRTRPAARRVLQHAEHRR